MSFFRIPTVIFAFIFSIIAIFPNSVLAETYTSELQAAYGLSAEDALYVSQRMEFEGVTMSDTDKVTEFVSERTSERTSQALVYPTRVTSVRAEESSPGIFKVSFDLKNDGAAQSGIKYRVNLRALTAEEETVEPRTYSITYPEVLTLQAGESMSRTVEFEVPNYTPSDEYIMAVELSGSHGNIFAVGTVPDLIVVNNQPVPLAVDFSNCGLQINSGEEGLFDRLEGVDVTAEEEIYFTCRIKNTSSETVTAYPQFTTYLRNIWGEQIGEVSKGTETLSFEAGEEKEVKILIPKELAPQAYDVKVDLLSGDVAVSEPVIAHYVIQGQSATIQSLTMDSSRYEADKLIRFNLAWTGSADDFTGSRSGSQVEEGEELTAEVFVTTLEGAPCGDATTQTLPRDTQGLASIDVPIIFECPTVVAEVVLKSADGTVFAEQTFNFSVVEEEDVVVPTVVKDQTSTKMLAIVVFGAFILILASIILLARRKKKDNIVIALAISLVSFGISAAVYAGNFYVAYDIWDVPNKGWGLHQVWGTFSGPSGTYRNSQTFAFSGNITNVTCANSRARSRFELRITGPQNISGNWNASSFSYSRRANQLVNGNYRGVVTWIDTGCKYFGGGRPNVPPRGPDVDYQCNINPARSETFYFTIDNDPSGSVSAGGCTIVAGASTCTTRVTWSILNPNYPASTNLRNLTHSYVYSWAASGNAWQTLWYGTQTLAARDNHTNLATVNVTASCAAGTVWTGSICSPAPVVTLAASPTLVGPGNSSTLTWTVSGATSCTASGGWSGAKSATGGSEAVSPSATTVYTLTCTSASGSTVRNVTVTLPTGSLTAGGCTIAPEASSCLSTVSWTAANFLGAAQVTQTTSGVAAGSNPGTLAVSPDARTIKLDDLGSNFEITAMANASCSAGGVWVPSLSRCAALPVIDLNIDPDVIRSGNTADVGVTVTSPYDLTCTLTGGIDETIDHTGAATAQSYTATTNPLTSAQIVSITCVADIAADLSNSSQGRVNVVPTVQEI